MINFQSPRLNCLKCEEHFPNRDLLFQHYEVSHAIERDFKYLYFTSIEDFEKWLSPCYALKNTWTTSLDTCVLRYRCHRSGIYQDSFTGSNKKRKRRLRLGGTKKLQGFCIAEVTLRQRLSDGLCVVTLQATHVGHSIHDDSEVRHMYLSRSEKEWIASQLLNGVPKYKILEKITENNEIINASDNRRLSAVSLKDIHNIAASWKADVPPSRADDPAHVDVFVSQHADSILYYKKQDEHDAKYDVLNDNDFVVVYQTPFQKTLLVKYGHKVVAFDGIHGLNPYNFTVHSLLIVDAENEGFAVAFLVSNRSDQAVMEIFVACIRDNCGVVNAATLMSDMDGVYYNAWQSVMGPPKHSIFCSWHVRKVWRENLRKLVTTNTGERDITKDERQRVISLVEKQLYDLADDLDEMCFTNKLESFLRTQDPVVEPFLDYFRKNYVSKNTDAWASCYHAHAGMNVNMRVESFHRTLKYNIAKKKKVGTLAAGLHCLEFYVKQRSRQYLGKKYRPKVTSKLTALRKRHLAAEKYVNEQPLKMQFDEDLKVWKVNSFTPSKDGVVKMYCIQKNEISECSTSSEGCTLSCFTCRSCFHEYKCSCRDSTVQSNMCKHIHALCLFHQLQNVSAQSEATVTSEAPCELPLELSDEEQAAFSVDTAGEVTDKEKVISDIKKTFTELTSTLIENVTDENFQDWYPFYDQFLSKLPSAFELFAQKWRRQQQ